MVLAGALEEVLILTLLLPVVVPVESIRALTDKREDCRVSLTLVRLALLSDGGLTRVNIVAAMMEAYPTKSLDIDSITLGFHLSLCQDNLLKIRREE